MTQRKLVHGFLAALLVMMQLLTLLQIRSVHAVEQPSVTQTLVDNQDLSLDVEGQQNGDVIDWTVNYERPITAADRALKLDVKAGDTTISPRDPTNWQQLQAVDPQWWQESEFSTQAKGSLHYQTPIDQPSLTITAQLDEQTTTQVEAVTPQAVTDGEAAPQADPVEQTPETTVTSDLLDPEIAGPHTVTMPQTQAEEEAAIDDEIAEQEAAEAVDEAVTTAELPEAATVAEAQSAPVARATESVTKPSGTPFVASNLVLTLTAGANTGQTPEQLIQINVLTADGTGASPHGTIKSKSTGSHEYNSRSNMENYTSHNYVAGSKSRAVFFENSAEAQASKIEVSYPHVGQVQDANGVLHEIGAFVTVSDFKYANLEWSGTDRNAMAIDFASNFYSGISIANTRSFKWEVTFFLAGTTTPIEFTENSGGKLTFTSLNPGEFVQTNSGLEFSTADSDAIKLTKLNSKYLAPVNWDHENGWGGSQSFKEFMAMENGAWPGQGEAFEVEGYTSWKWGNWSKSVNDIEPEIEWQDKLGAPTFGHGAAAFALAGTTFSFTRGSYAVAGSTWLANASGDAEFIVPQTLNLNKSISSEEFEAGGSYDDIKDLDKEAIYTNNNLHEQNVNDFAEPLTPMYYYINQETYNIPTEVVSRPSQIIITDTLPAGIETWTADAKANVVVYNEKPSTTKTLPATVEPSRDAEGRQVLTITLKTDATTAMSFTGGYFSIRIKVKTTHKLDQLTETVRMENQAFVKMLGAKGEVGYDDHTNTVWTELTPPKPPLVAAEFIKVDEFGKALKGVTFGLFANEDAQGQAIQTQTSTADGTVKFTDLAPGDYWLKETNTPAGYVPLTQSIKITIQSDGTIKWPADWTTGNKVVNELKPWTIELEKTDDQQKRLNGAEFTLTTANGTEIAKGTTDGNSALTFNSDKLLPGDYVLTETKAPTGFEKLTGKFTFTLKLDGTVEAFDYTGDDLKDGQYKFDAEDHLLSLNVENNAEEIPLPVTGGNGIQALIAASVVIMLMALMLGWHWRKEVAR